MKEYISKRAKNIEVSLTKQMPIKARELVLEGKLNQEDIISLGQGIPSMKTLKYIRDAVIDKLETDDKIFKYSLISGRPDLKEAIAKRLEKKTNRPVDPEKEILISIGAIEALAISMFAIINKGDEFILPDPSYSSYSLQVKLVGGKPIFVPLDSNNNWKMDIDALSQKITPRTKAILICAPSNPTGAIPNKEEIDKIAKLVTKNDLLIFADETYGYLVYDNHPFKSFLEYPELKERLIYVNSFSKEFAMSGWRVGYLYAPSFITQECLKIHDSITMCAPGVSQYAALAALTKEPLREDPNMIEIHNNRRKLMCKKLDELSDLFSYQEPKGGYYILVKYLKTNLNSLEFASKLLEETGIITVPGSAFGPGGEAHIRMSFCATEEEIEKAFLKIKEWSKTL